MAFKLKPPRTFDDQLKPLKDRQLVIDNDGDAIHKLRTLNYYRLSGYSYQFKDIDPDFRIGTKFDTVIRLHQYDQKLRNVIMQFLEIIELCARTQIAYSYSHNYGSYGHYDFLLCNSEESYNEFHDTLNIAIKKNADALFVAKHKNKYGGYMPLWVAFEILSFSALSKFYKNIFDNAIKKEIASHLGADAKYLENWLHCLSILRNTCAHYGRMYNRIFKPSVSLGNKTYSKYGCLQTDMFYGYLIVILSLLPEQSQCMQLITEIEALNEAYKLDVDLSCLGYSSNWKKHFELWKHQKP